MAEKKSRIVDQPGQWKNTSSKAQQKKMHEGLAKLSKEMSKKNKR